MTIREDGIPPVDQVKEEIRFYVSKEKKAEYLIAEIW